MQAQTPTQTEVKRYTFDEFIAWYPENSDGQLSLTAQDIFNFAL